MTFTTPAITAGPLPPISIPNPAGPNTAPGVEMIDIVMQGGFTTTLQAVVTDLSGNAIWYYPLASGETPFPIKLLPNGHMLLNTNGTSNTTREIDLAGNILYEVTVDQVNQSLDKLTAGFHLVTFSSRRAEARQRALPDLDELHETGHRHTGFQFGDRRRHHRLGSKSKWGRLVLEFVSTIWL